MTAVPWFRLSLARKDADLVEKAAALQMTACRPWARPYGICARVALAVAVCAGLAACAKSTKASPYDRECGTARSGFVTTDDRWQSSGPWHVEMSSATASSIARRVGPSEFQPAGSHPPAKDVPCVVASSVAYVAAESWSIHQAKDESVRVAWASYASGPSFGRFRCLASRAGGKGVEETCLHRADRHAGAITVELVVRPAPRS